ncbi:MAG: hypothetical protein K0R69_2884 [Clostridia bacterium]|jgi:hypothetical protein|nr:hypothetical protein [Clostridia bacterium]
MRNKQILIIRNIILLFGIIAYFFFNRDNGKENLGLSDSNNLEQEVRIEFKEPVQNQEETLVEDQESSQIVNELGATLEERYNPPSNFVRVRIQEDSFADFLRKMKLKPYGEKVLYYNGQTKPSEGVYDSVVDVQIGDRDLHQCADAIMLLRAEYLYAKQEYDKISFNFSNGFEAEYQKWMDGYKIHIDGNRFSWSKQSSFSNDYESFRKYMNLVFAYAGTATLEKQLNSVSLEEMSIGDVFIKGGSPGHAVIVVDMAENTLTGEKAFILAQSYMPAQQTQILINPANQKINPWYIVDTNNHLRTPEWKFEASQLKRFP